jgi:hypothetical protein
MTSPRIRRVAIVFATLAGAALLVVGAFFGPSPGGSPRAVALRRSNPVTQSSTTTTTVPAPPPTAPPLTAVPPTTAAPVDAAAPAAGVPTADPVPPVTPPDGVEAASDPAACTWDDADGGTLRASGTVTNTASDDDTWLVTVDWVDDSGFVDSESDYFHAPTGQSVPWSLTVTGSDPPTGALRCGVEIV